jgi:hypothetical protein
MRLLSLPWTPRASPPQDNNCGVARRVQAASRAGSARRSIGSARRSRKAGIDKSSGSNDVDVGFLTGTPRQNSRVAWQPRQRVSQRAGGSGRAVGTVLAGPALLVTVAAIRWASLPAEAWCEITGASGAALGVDQYSRIQQIGTKTVPDRY